MLRCSCSIGPAALNRTTRIVMIIGIDIVMAVSLQLINGFSGQFSLGHAGFMAVGAPSPATRRGEICHRG